MANHRISKDKRAFILATIREGTPINGICRMLGVRQRLARVRTPSLKERSPSFITARMRNGTNTNSEVVGQNLYGNSIGGPSGV